VASPQFPTEAILANFKHTKAELDALRVRREAAREASTDFTNDNQVLTHTQWCALNNFSGATGKRIIASGEGPPIIRLSARRYGISVGANRKWQLSRTQSGMVDVEATDQALKRQEAKAAKRRGV
jgi:hypothetical protein